MGAEILSDSLPSAWCSSLCSQQLLVKGVHYGGASSISVWCAGLSSGGLVLLSSDHSVDPLRNRFENSEKIASNPTKMWPFQQLLDKPFFNFMSAPATEVVSDWLEHC